MGILLRIFGAFILIISLGVVISVVRSVAVGNMMDRLNYQQDIVREALAADTPEEKDAALARISGAAYEIFQIEEDNSRLMIFLAIATVLIGLAIALAVTQSVSKNAYWYESILNNTPLPVSVTDMNRRTVFINSPVEKLLGVKREDVLGKDCGDVWKAGICNTQKCGIECLKAGNPTTTFSQSGFDFKVSAAYIRNKKGKPIGHIEIVQDISELVQQQRLQTMMIDGVRSTVDSFSTISRQITETSESVAREANENAAILSEAVQKNSKQSKEQMDEMLQITREINDAMSDIEKIVELINNIARQTI